MLKFPDDISNLLSRRFKNKRREWLTANGDWPLKVKLGIPTEQAIEQLDVVDTWVTTWREWRGAGTLCWTERHWRRLGVQRVPAELTLATPAEVAEWCGESERWNRANKRYQFMLERWPKLEGSLARHFDLLADYSETDFNCLILLIDWLSKNPATGLYPRQLPVAGLNSKWLEGHKGPVAELTEAVCGLPSGTGDIYHRCGLKSPPHLIRLRLLDRSLRERVGGLGDISAPLEQLAELNLPIDRVLVVENLQTGLACEDLLGTTVIMGLGYGVDVLGRLPWIERANCIYWGDIDTNGFAILNRARSSIPNIQSVLMDEKTLNLHRNLWVKEKKPSTADTLPLLTTAEQSVYQALKNNIWGQNVRLEQERLDWKHAWATVQQSLSINA